jgi:hypothetical protein
VVNNKKIYPPDRRKYTVKEVDLLNDWNEIKNKFRKIKEVILSKR